MRTHNATIKDVAATARVSTATVSNVLHGKTTLYSAETAQAVWKAIHSLGYRPNRIARSLVRRATDTLGVVVDRPHGRLTHNPYMSSLLDGFLEYAVDAGYQIKLISLLMQDPREALAQLDDGSVDGLALFAPPHDSPLLTRVHSSRVPVVIAGSAPPELPFAGVDLDDRAAAYTAIHRLIEMGHRRIGWVSGPPSQASVRSRETGYLQALCAAGVEAHSAWRYQGDYESESAIDGVVALMGSECPPSAILFWNDGMAVRGMRHLLEMGYRVPEDVSIIGFDDIELSQWVKPTLTTIRQPVSEMGKKAADILIRQIQTGLCEEDVHLFEGALIVRESVAPYKEKAPTKVFTK